MDLTLVFSSLSDSERDDLAARLLEQAEVKGLAVRLPERTRPYTVAEAAEELALSEVTIYRMLDAGRLRAVPGLARKRIVAGSVHAVRDGLESVGLDSGGRGRG